ncbi:MAG: hypothetical protein Fur0046_32260 [Cyanobacteria bacterium J069]
MARLHKMMLVITTLSITSSISLSAGFGIYIAVQHHIRKDIQETLSEAELLRRNEEYDDCIRLLNSQPNYVRRTREVKALRRDCLEEKVAFQLKQVGGAIAQGHLEQAMKHLAEPLRDARSSHHRQPIRQLEQLLCDRLLKTATQEYEKAAPDYLNHALYPLGSIPGVAQCYPEAQQQIERWQAEHMSNAQLFQAAEESYKQGNFQDASQHLGKISRHPYWQLMARSLAQSLQYEPIVRKAREFLAQEQPDNAIHMALQLPDLPPWQEQKVQILRQADAQKRRQRFCESITLGFWHC